MARRPIPSVAGDFSLVVSFLKDHGIVTSTPPVTLIETARKIHRATFSLILWRFRLKGLPDHGRVFIEEIASDALQILPQVLMGYGKSAKLLTRGIVENTLRHVYFSDHPIEFQRMNRESKWYVRIDELFDYAKIHPALLRTEPRFDAISRLSALHSELSAGIHGRQVRDLEMRVALNKITYSAGTARTEAQLIERCAESANFLLAVFHRASMASFQLEDRQIILHTMPPRARSLWSEMVSVQ
jgi:hypothetical protein